MSVVRGEGEGVDGEGKEGNNRRSWQRECFGIRDK